jgi:outer membrane protein assembly factor BamA
MQGEWLVGAQAASLLASRLTQGVSQRLRGLGLDQVLIEPNLIQREAHPSARLTFGKNLTSWSTLIYSYSLEDAEERLFRLEMRPLTSVGANIARREDGSYLGGVTHRFQLGAPTPTRPRTGLDPTQSVRLDDVRFEGTLPATPAELQQMAGVKPGQKSTLWNLHDAAQNLQRRLVERGHIEAQASARLDKTTAIFAVYAGPLYQWRVSGMDRPPDLTPIVRKALYAEEALSKGSERLLEDLRGRGHLEAAVRTEIQGMGDERTLVFTAEPGPVYATSSVTFEGASALSHGTLLRAAGGAGELLTEPARARRRIEERYGEEYFLEAKVGPPRVEKAADRVTVHVTLQEGRQAHIARLTFQGSSLHEDELTQLTSGLVGTTPDELRISAALQRIRERYFTLGYPYIRVLSRLVPADGDLEMRVEVQEGPQVHIREILIEGKARVPESILRAALPFRVGDPLDPRKLVAAETRLARYKVSRSRVTSDEKDAGRIVVTLRPGPRLTADYGVDIDAHSDLAVSANVRAPNLLPRGATPGLVLSEAHYNRRIHGSLGMPAFFHRGTLDVAFTLEDHQERSDGSRPGSARAWKEVGAAPFDFRILERRGTVTQSVEVGGRWILEYGYELKHATTETEKFVVPFEADVGKVRLSLLRDTRDSLLDARNGRFWNLSLSYAPMMFGTDFEFVRGYGQLFVYRSLMPQLTWAHAYRLGLGKGIGGSSGGRVFVNDRFTAGGSNSLRGYGTDLVGPIGTDGPEAGDALIVINQELRYHHATGLGAALFYDVGNVYTRIEDVDLDLRHAVGVGLRYDSPVGLLRVDFGIPLNRRRDIDDPYQLFFSLGQAF